MSSTKLFEKHFGKEKAAREEDKPCNVCDRDIVRTAITYNGIKICHSCLKFFKYQAKLNNRTWEEEIDYQTKYMKFTNAKDFV